MFRSALNRLFELFSQEFVGFAISRDYVFVRFREQRSKNSSQYLYLSNSHRNLLSSPRPRGTRKGDGFH